MKDKKKKARKPDSLYPLLALNKKKIKSGKIEEKKGQLHKSSE